MLPAVNDTVDTVGATLTDVLGTLDGMSLLDLDADLDLDVDLAAPVGAAIGANGNVAVPIDAAVAADVLSPDATSYALADQDSMLQQALAADAIANASQDSSINQGEISEPPLAETDNATTTTGGPVSLLDLAVDLDLALDLAAPIDAAVAANLNVAAPIDAAVSANILSPNSTSMAIADQDSAIIQSLTGLAEATATQVSTIEQGETA